MDEMYGIHSTGGDYSDKALMSPDNLINIAAEYNQYQYYESLIPSSAHHNRRINDAAPFESEEFGLQCSVVSTDQSACIINVNHQNYSRDEDEEEAIDYNNGRIIKAKIASHPSYPKLLDAYIDCQKVGAPPEISYLLDEIRREKDDIQCKQDAVLSMGLGVDPELDEFMETYCDVLVKYKSDLSRPFDEATSFLNTIETQLANLCKDTDGVLSSDDEEFSTGGETEISTTRNEDRELKDKLLRRYGNHINSLKLEFSKKKKKGKLPKEARQTLLEWWSLHYKWPYPTEIDKISLAETETNQQLVHKSEEETLETF